jgi:hypothetical protein
MPACRKPFGRTSSLSRPETRARHHRYRGFERETLPVYGDGSLGAGGASPLNRSGEGSPPNAPPFGRCPPSARRVGLLARGEAYCVQRKEDGDGKSSTPTGNRYSPDNPFVVAGWRERLPIGGGRPVRLRVFAPTSRSRIAGQKRERPGRHRWMHPAPAGRQPTRRTEGSRDAPRARG